MKPLRLCVISVSLLVTIAATAMTDQLHYVNTFIGERAAGMGGAYTAIADGPEGMYYNPGGLAFAPANYISVSTNAFEFRNWTYEDIAETGVDFERSSFALVPNFFGFVQRGARGVWGFTILSPDSISVNLRDTLEFPSYRVPAGELEDYDQDQNVTQQKTLAQDLGYQVFEVGPAYGFALGDKLGLGFALFGGLTTEEELYRETDRYTITEDGSYIAQLHRSITTDRNLLTLRPRAGFQYLISENVTLGLATSIGLPIYEQSGSATTVTGNEEFAGGLVEQYETESRNILADGIFTYSTVSNRFGVAWFASRRLILSGDVALYLPINPSDTSSEAELNPTWNAAAGMEYYLGQNFPLRVGVFTNNANSDVPQTGATAQPEHVDLYGITASIGFATADISLSLGGMYSMGTGKAQLIAGDPEDIQKLRRTSASVFVSGGYLF